MHDRLSRIDRRLCCICSRSGCWKRYNRDHTWTAQLWWRPWVLVQCFCCSWYIGEVTLKIIYLYCIKQCFIGSKYPRGGGGNGKKIGHVPRFGRLWICPTPGSRGGKADHVPCNKLCNRVTVRYRDESIPLTAINALSMERAKRMIASDFVFNIKWNVFGILWCNKHYISW